MVMEMKDVIVFVVFLLHLLDPTISDELKKTANPQGYLMEGERMKETEHDSRSSEKSQDGFISKQTADNLHILFGGIGPVMNPPGLSLMNPEPISEPEERHVRIYRNVKDTNYVEEKDKEDDKTSKKVQTDFISKEMAEKLHLLYGGIGPVMNPPGLSSVGPLPISEPKENNKNVYRKTRSTRNLNRKSDTEGDAQNKPEQIHISYGETPAEMTVMWATPLKGSSEVLYGRSSHNLDKHVEGEVVQFSLMNLQGLQYIHRVNLMGLTPDQKYYYLVKTGSEKSDILHFKTMKAGYDWSPTLFIFGDMGVVGGAPSLRILNKAARNGSVDAIIHVGDFAYDLHDENGKVGDDFMNRIQYVASRIPYMTCVGNHEIADGTFSHYRNRFSMPGVKWPTPIDSMWYSFNMGVIHFISYSTEVYFTNGPVEKQLRWLRQDLQEANTNRERRPWVIAFGHRPMYCSNNDRDDCTKLNSVVRGGFEKLFYDAGVDIIIEAHEHSYERFFPMYQGKVTEKHYRNPQAPVHIIGGAAGCNEFDKICVNPIFGPKGPWSAFRSWLPGLYGVGKLFAANATHLHWQQLLAVNSQTLDQFWIEQNNHGPFSPVDTEREM